MCYDENFFNCWGIFVVSPKDHRSMLHTLWEKCINLLFNFCITIAIVLITSLLLKFFTPYMFKEDDISLCQNMLIKLKSVIFFF